MSEPVEHEDALAELARALERGRVRRRLKAVELAGLAGLGRTVASQALNGARVPSTATVTALARVLGLDTEPLLLLRDRATRATGGGKCPYPGMAAFGAERSSVFFGRSVLVADLVEHLDRRTRDGGIQMVVGASGAGKSSLLRAGLVPRLAAGALDDPWSSPTVVVLTPSGDPPAALTRALADAGAEDIARVPADAGRCVGGVIVVVDQFEEVFTECPDATARRAFVASLTTLAAGGSGGALPRALVVVGVRDDFYPACQRHRELGDALADRPVRVGPLTPDGLCEAITRPARAAQLTVQPALVERLLADFGVRPPIRRPDASTAAADANPADEYAAGRLPLLAHALRATWRERVPATTDEGRGRGGTLTLQGYEDTGGIGGAVQRSADHVWDTLDDVGRREARALFLRLVRLGESPAEDTRRRAVRSDLAAASHHPDALVAVANAFTDERLLTQYRDSVEITHESLLQAWPRLRDWIGTDRDAHLVRQRLEEDAAEWDRPVARATMGTGTDPVVVPRREAARLYSGSRLRQAHDHAEAHEVSRTARAFLDACDAAVEETRRTREAEQLRKHRNRRRWRIATAVIGVLAVLAATTSVVAVRFAVESDRRGDRLRNELNAALSRELSIEAERLRGIDVSLAAQADIAAYRKDPSPTTLGNLLDSAARPLAAVLPDSPSNRVLFSPDRRTLATATFGRTGTTGDTTHDASITLWGVGDPERPLRLADFPIRGSTEIGLAFSPDGRTLAVAGKGFIEFRNTADPHQPTLRASNGSTAREALSFSPDGRSLAVTANDGIDLWNTSDPDHPVPQGVHFGVSADRAVSDIAFSPTGHTLAATDGNSVRLWDTTVAERPSPRPRTLDGHTAPIDTLAFSPDGLTIATGGRDAAVHLWNLTDIDNPTPWRRPLAGGSASVTSIAFSPDGHTLATADRDATARLWNISDPDRTIPRTDPLFAHNRDQNGRGLPNTGTNLSFSADGRILASPGPTRLWTLPTYITTTRTGGDGNPATFRYSPDGHTLAVAASGEIRLWDFVRPGHPTPRAHTLATDRETATALSFSPDGRTLAAVTSDTSPRIVKLGPDGRPPADSTDDQPTATIRFWNLTAPDRPTPRPHALTGFPAARTTVLYSPDGRTLVAVGQGHGWQTWDVSDPDRPALRAAIGTGTELTAALSPDGRTLAVSIFDPHTNVVLWDVADPTRPKRRPGSITLDSDMAFAVAFGANGRTLVTAGSRSTRLWDTSDPDHPTPRPNSLDTNGDSVDSLSLTTDGDMLATSGISATMRLWDLTDPDHPAPHTTPIAASWYRPLDFSPDGRTLAFMEETDAVSLRLLRAQDAIRHICTATTGSFEQAGQALRHTLTPPCPTPPNG